MLRFGSFHRTLIALLLSAVSVVVYPPPAVAGPNVVPNLSLQSVSGVKQNTTVQLTAQSPPWSAADLAQRQTWGPCDHIIGTTYFYWYRYPDQHFTGLTNHFVSPSTVSFLSKAWHKKELSDMIDAGIDMLWPDYWGAPGSSEDWSYSGLAPLQQAINELRAEGKTPPKIGMFYDTNTLLFGNRGLEPEGGKPDLTTDEGKELFYQTIRGFFALVHPKYWACMNGRPIVVLYVAYYAYAHNLSTFDYVYTHFEADFGVRPYIIKEIGWHPAADSSHQWGAALYGPFLNGIAAIGPGFDNSAVSGNPYIRSRENSDNYRSSWQTVLQSGLNMVHVESWNEMHEATDICESVEYGRQYINLTRQYADQFKLTFIPVKVTAFSLTPGTRLSAPPTAITANFSVAIDPATVNTTTFLLTGSGPDGVFGTADDVSIMPASVSVSSQQAILDLTGANMPEQYYRVTLRGAGGSPIADLCGHPLFGTFNGTFPSGANGIPGDFVSTFWLHAYAKADFDEDDDVDQSDFGHLQACLSGGSIAQTDPQCQNAKLDNDEDVDQYDLDIFLRCMSGSGVRADPNCAN